MQTGGLQMGKSEAVALVALCSDRNGVTAEIQWGF